MSSARSLGGALALVVVTTAASATAAPATAAPATERYVVVALGTTAGAETFVGVTAALRAGLRAAGDGAPYGGFVECAATSFSAFGPYTGGASQHCLLAAEGTLGPAPRVRFHLYAGLALEHLARPATEHQRGFDELLPGAAVGLGTSWRWLRIDLEGRAPLRELIGDGGELGLTPQVQLTAGLVLRP